MYFNLEIWLVYKSFITNWSHTRVQRVFLQRLAGSKKQVVHFHMPIHGSCVVRWLLKGAGWLDFCLFMAAFFTDQWLRL